jgi:oligopeptide transport system permease protein
MRTGEGVIMVDVLVNYYEYMNASDAYFWFGSDNLGRDLFTRLFRGARISLIISFWSVIANLLIGVVYGAIMGYYGDPADMYMSRVIEVLGGIPNLVVIIMFRLVYGSGIFSLIMALCMTGWIPVARLTRAQFYRSMCLRQGLWACATGR